MVNETFFIDETLLEDVQNTCNYIKDEDLRERAVANVLAPKIVSQFFEGHDVDVVSGLHNVPQVLEQMEISDIYVDNSYLDVRLYFNDKDLCVPKRHFDNNLLPVAYMFVRLNSTCDEGAVTGFIRPEDVDKSDVFDNYYPIDENSLVSFYEIEPLLVNNNFVDCPKNLQSDIYKFLDNELEDKISFYQLMLNSSEARNLLLDIASVENILYSAKVSISQDSVGQEINIANENNDDLELVLNLENEELSLDIDSPEIMNLDDNSEIESFNETSESLLEEAAVDSNETEDFNLNQEYDLLEQDDSETLEENSIIADEITDFETLDFVQSDFDDKIIDSDDNADMISEFKDETIEENLSDLSEFSTKTTPSIAAYDTIDEAELEDVLENQDIVEMVASENDDSENDFSGFADVNEQIDALFNQESLDESVEENSEEPIEEEVLPLPKKKKTMLLPLLSIALVIAGGWFGYSKYFAENSSTSTNGNNVTNINDVSIPTKTPAPKVVPTVVPMPIETVENIEVVSNNNEGTNAGIPAIEQNLDASIVVSNLGVSWEVPATYVTNATAKRYFTKLGKIVRLNLKTDLLLLNSMPITNKVTVELEFNPQKGHFIAKNIKDSSGEKSVDNIILNTVNQALGINLNMNISSFANGQVNPILIISF